MSTSKHDHDREEGLEFQPKFDASGLVTCVATDAATGDVLMVAHMNDEALRKTIASGEAWYFSRSRNALWRKGETSGQTQRVVEMRMDCDQDAVWIRVEQTGAACHTGRRSCFYRKVDGDDAIVIRRRGQAVRSKGGLPRIAFGSSGRKPDHSSSSAIMRAARLAPSASTGFGLPDPDKASIIASAIMSGVEAAKSISVPAP